MILQIVIFAAVAAVVLVKLYNVLGKDVGAPPQRSTPPTAARGTPSKPVAPTVLRPAFTGPAAAGLEAIHAADGRFDPQDFLAGARIAYERVVEAYSKGEKKVLRNLLQPDVFTRYGEAIDARQKSGTVLDTEIIRIKKAEIKEATLDGKRAVVVVAFSAEISTQESHVDKPDDVHTQSAFTTEEWTFVRDVRTRDPNWTLASVATLA